MLNRKRDTAFIASEKMVLIELVEKHFSVVECKKTDNVTMRMKTQEWQNIAMEFNAISSIYPRDWTVLKICWENFKKRAKQAQTLRNQHFMGTGGGPPKKILEDPAMDRVLELIQTRVTGFTNTYDSDGTHVLASGSNSTQDEEGTSQVLFLNRPTEHEECSNDAGELVQVNPVPVELFTEDWSQYTPSMLRLPRNLALVEPEPESQPGPVDELPVTDLQVPVAGPSIPDHHQASNTPLRTCATRVAAANTSRRRPVARRERDTQTLTLTAQREQTLLQCNKHADEDHNIQIKILQLREKREKEMLEQEKIKTMQEKIKLEILDHELKKLKE